MWEERDYTNFPHGVMLDYSSDISNILSENKHYSLGMVIYMTPEEENCTKQCVWGGGREVYWALEEIFTV